MATACSKTLSKRDLVTWHNDAVEHAFQLGHISNTEIAHILNITPSQVQNLEQKWAETGNLTTVLTSK